MTKEIEKLTEKMNKEGIDWYAAFTCDPHGSEYLCEHYMTVKYLTHFTGDNGAVLVSKTGKAYLFTDGRFFIQAERELGGTGTELMRVGETNVKRLHELLECEAAPGERICTDISCMPERTLKKLRRVCEKKQLSLEDRDLAGEIWTGRPQVEAHPVTIMEDGIFGGSVKEKLDKIRNRMKEHDMQELIIKALDDVMWIFNLRGSDIPYNTLAYSYARITQDEAQVYLYDNAVTDEVKRHLEGNGVAILRYEDFPVSGRNISAASGVKAGGEKAMTGNRSEEQSLCKGIDDTVKVCSEKRAAASRIVAELKAVKTERQIENIRKYFELDSAALIRFLYRLEKRLGEEDYESSPMYETGAAVMLHEERAGIPGFIGESFPTISAYGRNAAMAHYAPDAEHPVEIKRQGLYLCDSGGFYPGVTTDVTRTVSCGSVYEEEKLGYTAVASGFLRLMNAVFRKGCMGSNLDILARMRLWGLGADYGHGTGHGVGAGLCVHEGPQSIRWKRAEDEKEAELLPGMLVTDEPGLYLQEGDELAGTTVRRGFGIRTENTLLVTEHEKQGYLCFEPLTLVPLDMSLISEDILSTEEMLWLDAYHRLVYERMSKYFEGDLLDWLAEKCRYNNVNSLTGKY